MAEGADSDATELLARVRDEIEERLVELRSAMTEYEELLDAAAAFESRERAADGAAEQAIVVALEHGSHTVGELVLVTAMPGPEVRAGLRGLLKARRVVRARRAGRIAYALSSTA
jgi:hypothetical protein